MPKAKTIPRATLIYVSGSVVVIAAILLAFLQFRWIRDSNYSERERERRGIRISLDRAVEELSNEVRALVSFAFVPEREGDGVDVEAIVASIDLWSDQAEDAELFRRLYIIEMGNDTAYEISNGEAKEVPVPRRYVSVIEDGSGNFRNISGLTSVFDGGVIILPYDWRVTLKSDDYVISSVSRYLVIELDLFVLLNIRFPDLMETYLPGYSYRISDGEDVKYVYGDANFEDRTPDEVHILFAPAFDFTDNSAVVTGSKETGPPGTGPPDTDFEDPALRTPLNKPEERDETVVFSRSLSDPASRFWYLRLRSDQNINVKTIVSPAAGEESRFSVFSSEYADLLAVELYYPNLPFEKHMNRRMLGDLLVSYGFLLLFVSAILVLFLVYRRSERYRLREREFVSAMSHELRTPVSVIGSISENLADGVSINRERLAEYGSLIREQSRRLGRMVESILMVAGLNQGEVSRAEWSSTNIASLIDDVARMLEPTARAEGMEIRCEIHSGTGEFLIDRIALRLILENLLMNAIRHAKPGHGGKDIVTIGARIIPDLDPESRWFQSRRLMIWVEDEGPGIPSREQKHVFDAFYRGAATRDNQTPGSGLGLHLVRRAARLIGGEVRLESPYSRKGVEIRGVRIVVDITEEKGRLHGD